MSVRAVAIVCLLFAANARAVTLGAFDGLPVLDVEVEGGGDEVKTVVDIQRGYILSSDEITKVVKRIYALGEFSDVQVFATPVGGAVSLKFVLVPQSKISDVLFWGDKEDDVVTDLKTAALPGEALTENTLVQLQKRCEHAFSQIGYEHASCEVTADNNGVVTVKMQKNAPTVVTQVNFVGNVRAPRQALMQILQLKPGTRFTDKKFKDDERALRLEFYNRHFLTALVRSEAAPDPALPNGVVINDTINAGDRLELNVTGNHVFKDEALIALLHRQPDERVFPSTIDDWRKRVLEQYFAHGYATAHVVIEHYLDSPRGVRHTLLRISEGPRIEVKTLTFPGAHFFPEWRLKNEVFGTLDSAIDVPLLSGRVDADATQALLDPHAGRVQPMPISGVRVTHPIWREDTRKTYDPAAYASACDNLRLLYLEQGFTEVKVGPPALLREGKSTSAEAVVPIVEGPRTLVHSLNLPHLPGHEEEEVFALSHVKPGEPYSDLQIEETKAALQKALADRGYIYAQISAQVALSADRTEADVAFDVQAGDEVRIGRILIEGNTITKDYVVKQRIALKAGQPYSPDLALKTKDNLLGTNTLGGIQSPIEAFESAKISLLEPDTPAEQKDIIVHVVERQLHSLDFSAGLSTGQGLRGSIDYTNHNFLGSAWVLNLHLGLNRQLPFFINPLIYGAYSQQVAERYDDNFNDNVVNGKLVPLTSGEAAGNFLLDSIERTLRASFRSPRFLTLPGEPLVYVEASNERRNAIAYSLNAFSLLGGIDVAINRQMNFVFENSLNYNELGCYATPSVEGSTITQTTSVGGQCPVYNGAAQLRVPKGDFLSARFGTRFILDLRPLEERANPRHGFVAEIKADLVSGEELPSSATYVNGTQIDTTEVGTQPYNFIRAEVKLHGFIPIGKRSSIMLAVMAGNIFALNGQSVIDILANERFYLGGATTLRGLVDSSLVPEDACVAPANSTRCANVPANRHVVPQLLNGQYQPPITAGGEFYVLYKGEFRFPLAGELFGVLFVDAGNLYYDIRDFPRQALKVNPGLGLRFATGVGSVALDWGFNVNPALQLGEWYTQFPYVSFAIY